MTREAWSQDGDGSAVPLERTEDPTLDPQYVEQCKSAVFQGLNELMVEVYKQRAKEIDALYEQLAESLARTASPFSFTVGDVITGPAPRMHVATVVSTGPGCPYSISAQAQPLPIAPLLMLAGMAFLSARRAEVAAAEGDYRSLVDEFIEWLRRIVAAWKAAADG